MSANCKTFTLNKPIFFLFFFSFGFFSFASIQAKELFKVNGEAVTSEQLSNDARLYLSQNLSPEQVESLNSEQMSALAQSILVKKVLVFRASEDEQIKQSLEPGGNLDIAINRIRIDLVGQAYLDKIAKQTINAAMVEQQYESFKTQMEQAMQYELQNIVTTTKEQAQKARDEIRSGELFFDVAVKYSIDPQVKENRGSVGTVLSLQLDAKLEEELKNLRVYELSEPIEVGNNYVLVRYSSKTKPKTPSFDEVKNDIENELINSAKQQFINQIANQIKLEPIQ